MRFTGTLQLPTVAVEDYRRRLMDELKEQMVKGVTAWLTTADILVPVWSGASKATFSELASKVNFRLSIIKAARAPDRESLGRSKSEGTFEVDERKARITAVYSTTLDHLVFNEANNANVGGDPKVFSRLIQPGPYGFVAQANKAFEEAVADTNLPIPKVRTRTVRF